MEKTTYIIIHTAALLGIYIYICFCFYPKDKVFFFFFLIRLLKKKNITAPLIWYKKKTAGVTTRAVDKMIKLFYQTLMWSSRLENELFFPPTRSPTTFRVRCFIFYVD